MYDEGLCFNSNSTKLISIIDVPSVYKLVVSAGVGGVGVQHFDETDQTDDTCQDPPPPRQPPQLLTLT